MHLTGKPLLPLTALGQSNWLEVSWPGLPSCWSKVSCRYSSPNTGGQPVQMDEDRMFYTLGPWVGRAYWTHDWEAAKLSVSQIYLGGVVQEKCQSVGILTFLDRCRRRYNPISPRPPQAILLSVNINKNRVLESAAGVLTIRDAPQ